MLEKMWMGFADLKFFTYSIFSPLYRSVRWRATTRTLLGASSLVRDTWWWPLPARSWASGCPTSTRLRRATAIKDGRGPSDAAATCLVFIASWGILANQPFRLPLGAGNNVVSCMIHICFIRELSHSLFLAVRKLLVNFSQTMLL